ncbi:MAG TPA: hypothetical protein EYP41_12810 [Anaerolineae bacterium]|nr:hypothetical protein [Anaerolineae bacterium]
MPKISRGHWFVFLACLLGFGLFLLISAVVGGKSGFPLDDAWIHQTYARSLARYGRFAYVPGVTSAGSTAPLWTILLSVGYVLHIPYLFWTYLLGFVSLLWLATAVMQVWRAVWPDLAGKDWLAGLTTALTWPLLWAAASGMETLLFAALGLQIAALYLRVAAKGQVKPGWLALLGILSGLLILIRPDGLVLLLLVALGLLLLPGALGERAKLLLVYGGTAVLTLIPYFLFNYLTSGAIWPNTFYAKQTEYAAVLQQFIGTRILQLFYFSLGGSDAGWQGINAAHFLLLPGVIYGGWLALRRDWRQKQLAATLPLLWAGGHVMLYAWRLPVTFQHGRYLMTAIPIWLIYGLGGWIELLFARQSSGRALWLAQRVAAVTFALMLLFFLLQGALAYARDVAIVEGEMVTVAQWLVENTPEDALIASHDIGAIGYFAERPLLDLAGLISPEIIPLLADEAALEQYVLQSEADYLVTAPGWPYTAVANDPDVVLVFTTNFTLTQAAGLNNMTVYRLKTVR